MARRLPCVLRRPFDLISVPEVDGALTAARPGFLHGDPRAWAPGALAALQAGGAAAPMPWTAGCDLLLVPAPLPGHETRALLEQLRGMPGGTPVVVYERDRPVWPNLLLSLPAAEPEDPAQWDGATALRVYRSGFRHRGRGQAEALMVLPAARLARLLSGSWLASFRARGGYVNRRWAQTALDYERTYLLGMRNPGAPALPGARRVAVLMPHFDDEVVQCGGMIAQARADGAEVRLIWHTDGAQGIADKRGPESARLRRAEGEAAAAALGVDDLHFLDAPETRLSADGPWQAQLTRLLEEFEPERVHLTWWMDNHVDHYESARSARAAWPARLAEVPICASGAWTQLPFGATLPLAPEVVERRDRALACHGSQLEAVDYARAMRGLAAWYAQGAARDCPSAQAERYWTLPASEFWARFGESGADRRVWRS